MTYSQVEVQPDGTLNVPVPEGTLNLGAASRRFSFLLYGALVVVLGIFVFASYDTYLCTPLTEKLNARLIQGAGPLGSWLSYFELSVLGLAVLSLERFGFRFLAARPLLRMLFLFAAACVMLDLLNPNDEGMKNFRAPHQRQHEYLRLPDVHVCRLLHAGGRLPAHAPPRGGDRLQPDPAPCGNFDRPLVDRPGNYNFGAGATLTEGDSTHGVLVLHVALPCPLLCPEEVALSARLGRHGRAYCPVLPPQRALYRPRVQHVRPAVAAAHQGAPGEDHPEFCGGGLCGHRPGLVVMGTVSEDTQQYYFNRYFGMFMGMGQGTAPTMPTRATRPLSMNRPLP